MCKRLLRYFVVGLILTGALSNVSASVRLALVGEDSDSWNIVAALSVPLSALPDVVLVDRADTEKVFNEQTLISTATPLKLGQLLQADGILMISHEIEDYGKRINIRLVSVNPGVILFSDHFPIPKGNSDEWATGVIQGIAELFPKLAVKPTNAICLSIVDFHASLETADEKMLESRLASLLIRRLSRETNLFILERKRMEVLKSEKEFDLKNESEFERGKFLLDGVIDPVTYNTNSVEIRMRLTPPDNSAPIPIEITSSRTNMGAIVNQLAEKILRSMQIKQVGGSWKTDEEAAKYLDEAHWAMKWGLYERAEQACESAWTMGLRSRSVAELRIQSYGKRAGGMKSSILADEIPEVSKLALASRTLELYQEATEMFREPSGEFDASWVQLGYNALYSATEVLMSFNYAVMPPSGNEESLARLRSQCRSLIQFLIVQPQPPQNAYASANTCWRLGSLWYETPEGVFPLLEFVLRGNYFPAEMPDINTWSWEQRKRAPNLLKNWGKSLLQSTNEAVQIKGFGLALFHPKYDEHINREEQINQSLAQIWKHRDWLTKKGNLDWFEDKLPDGLENKHAATAYAKIQRDVFMDHMRRFTNYNWDVIGKFYRFITPEDASEVIHLARSYAQNRPDQTSKVLFVIEKMESVGATNATTQYSRQRTNDVVEKDIPIEAPLVQWKIELGDISPDLTPFYSRCIVREGQMWFLATYYSQRDLQRVMYIRVDPEKGVMDQIVLPKNAGNPYMAFEVMDGSIYASVQNTVLRCSISGKKWERLEIPVENSAQLASFNHKLIIHTDTSLMAYSPDTKNIQILATSRRKETPSALDTIVGNNSKLFRYNGKMGLFDGKQWLLFEPGTDKEISLSGFFTNTIGPILHFYNNDGVLSLYYTLGSCHVAGVIKGTSFTNLLQDYDLSSFKKNPDAGLLWEWPRSFCLSISGIMLDQDILWTMHPRKFWHLDFNQMRINPPKHIELQDYLDSRDATMMRFEPGEKDSYLVPVKFGTAPEGQEPFNINDEAPSEGFQHWGSNMRIMTSVRFWWNTPKGMVVSCPSLAGHWLIPKDAIISKVDSQRQARHSRDGTNKQFTPTKTEWHYTDSTEVIIP